MARWRTVHKRKRREAERIPVGRLTAAQFKKAALYAAVAAGLNLWEQEHRDLPMTAKGLLVAYKATARERATFHLAEGIGMLVMRKLKV